MPPLSFQAPPPRRLAVRRHFKPNGPTALSPHSGSRAVSQFAALVESATMHSFAAHSLRRSPDGSLAAVTVCLPITWPVPLWDRHWWREVDSNFRFRVARGACCRVTGTVTGATRGDLKRGQLYAGPRFRI